MFAPITRSRAVINVSDAASQAAMLALSGVKAGDMCRRTDLADMMYVLRTLPATVLANWTAITGMDPASVGITGGTIDGVEITDSDIFSVKTIVDADWDTDLHGYVARFDTTYTYPVWTRTALGMHAGLTVEIRHYNNINDAAFSHVEQAALGIAVYSNTANSIGSVNGIGCDMYKQAPCVTSNNMISGTFVVCSTVVPTAPLHGCGVRVQCSDIGVYTSVQQYAGFLTLGNRGWKYPFLALDETDVTIAYISHAGNIYSRAAFRQGGAAPAIHFWDEVGGVLGPKTAEITTIANVMYFNRRATAYGAYEGKPAEINIEAPDWSFVVRATGQVSMGAAVPDASAQLQLTSTTRGFLPPLLTTAQKEAIVAPAQGLVVWDADLGKMSIRSYGYLGTGTWGEVTSHPDVNPFKTDVGILSHDLVCMSAGKGVVMVNAAGTIMKRVRLNNTGDGLLYEDPSTVTTEPSPGTLANLITRWTNMSYNTLAATGADITSAINTAGTSENANTGLFWITVGESYTITATLTLNSGQAPTLYYMNNGVAQTPVVLAAGANVINFTATGNQSLIAMSNTLASNWACTFVCDED